jgi:hypothetical protein
MLTAGLWDDNLNYDFFTSYRAAHATLDGIPPFAPADFDAAHSRFAQRAAFSNIDAVIVLDTTGSMSDELSYLTAEFGNIQSEIAAAFPSASQRWALVVYRDTPATDPGDAYVFRTFDFTSDPQTFTATIGQQTAEAGGDYPESPEIGLSQLPSLSWRNDPTVARIGFWVADAPHHASRAPQMEAAIQGLQASGVHLYPVSASGTDDLLEYTMRSAAQLTGGRYLFLTDDSGIGDPHKIPEIPCYYVTLLEKALVRVSLMELSGQYIPPSASDVVRTFGDPTKAGACTTQGGQQVQIF